MGQGNSAPRVSGGVPWWLWGVALLATATVILVIVGNVDRESVDDVFAQAVQAAADRDRDALGELITVARSRGMDADRLGVLEGIHSAATVRHPRAVEQLQPFLDHDDEQLRMLALRYSAASYQAMGDARSAQELHQKSAEQAPEDIEPKIALLALYSDAGALTSAEEMARSILELNPDETYAREQLIFALGDCGRLEEAIEESRQLLDSDEAVASASPTLMERYLNWLLQENRLDEAAPFIQKYPKLIPDADLRFRAFLRCGLLENVSAMIEKLGIQDDHALSIWMRGVEAMEAEDWGEAVLLLGQVSLDVARSTLLFEHLEKAATNNNQPELAAACRQNIEQLLEIRKNRYEGAAAIGDDMSDPQLRLRLAELANELANRDDYNRWIKRAVAVSNQQQLRDIQLGYGFVWPTTTLVPIPGAFGKVNGGEEPGDAGAADTAAESEAGEETPPETPPETPADDPADDAPADQPAAEPEPSESAESDGPDASDAADESVPEAETASESAAADPEESTETPNTDPVDDQGDSEPEAE